MKNKTFICTLIALLMSFTSRSEVITGTSEPFQFGSPILVPLSILALVLSGGLIVFYTVKRHRAVEDKQTKNGFAGGNLH